MASAVSVFQLLVKVAADGTQQLDIIERKFKGIDRAAAGSAHIGPTFRKIGTVLGQASLGVGAVVGAFEAVRAAVDKAAEAEREANLDGAFARLGASAVAAKRELERGFRGIVNADDLRLIQSQMQAAEVGLADMGRAADAAMRISLITAKPAAEAMGLLNQAVATGRAGALKQAGVVLDTKAALDAYARSLGVAATDLDAATIRSINLEEAIRAVGAATPGTGLDDMATEAQRAEAALDDLSDALWELPGKAAVGFAANIEFLTDEVLGLIRTEDDLAAMRAGNLAVQEQARKATERESVAVDDATAFTAAWTKAMSEAAGEAASQGVALKDLARAIREGGSATDLTAAQAAKYLKVLRDSQPALALHVEALGRGSQAAKQLAGSYYDARDALIEVGKEQARIDAMAAAQREWNSVLSGFGAGTKTQAEQIAEMGQRLVDGRGDVEQFRRALRMMGEDAGMTADQIEQAYGSILADVGGKRARAVVDAAEAAAKASGGRGGGPSVSAVEDISNEEAEIRLALAESADEIVRIEAEKNLALLRLGEGRLGDLDAFVTEEEILARARTETAREEARRDAETMALVEAEEKRFAAERERQRRIEEQAEQDAHRARMDRLAEYRDEISYTTQYLGANFDAMGRMGWAFAEQMSESMRHAETAASAFAEAAVVGQDAYGRSIPAGIAASGRFASAFISNARAQAAVQGAFEQAAAWSALAWGNVPGFAMHQLSSALFFAVAAKGAGSQKSAGAGAGAGESGGASARGAAASQSSTAGPSVVNVTLTGLVIGSEATIGHTVARGLNAVAGRTWLNGDLIGPRAMGF